MYHLSLWEFSSYPCIIISSERCEKGSCLVQFHNAFSLPLMRFTRIKLQMFPPRAASSLFQIHFSSLDNFNVVRIFRSLISCFYRRYPSNQMCFSSIFIKFQCSIIIFLILSESFLSARNWIRDAFEVLQENISQKSSLFHCENEKTVKM